MKRFMVNVALPGHFDHINIPIVLKTVMIRQLLEWVRIIDGCSLQ